LHETFAAPDILVKHGARLENACARLTGDDGPLFDVRVAAEGSGTDLSDARRD